MRNGIFWAAALSAVLLGAPLNAAPPDAYVGPNGGNWNTAGSWSAGAIPNDTDGNAYDVTNTSANTVVHSSSLGTNGIDTISSLSFSGAGGLTLSGGIIAGVKASHSDSFSVSGPLIFSGGELSGFTLQNSDAATFGANGSTLDSMTLSGGLKVSTYSVNISGSFTYGANATFDLSANGGLAFLLNQTLANATLKMGGTTSRVSEDSLHTLTLDQTLAVLGKNAAFSGGTLINNTTLTSSQGGTWTISPTTFNNNGTVQAQGALSLMTITAATFTNLGTIQVLNGGTVTINPGMYMTNTIGTASASGSGSRLNLGGGALTLGQGENLSATNGGVIGLQTTLNNTGKTFDPLAFGPAGTFLLNGSSVTSGTISGGSVTNADSLRFSGLYNGLTNVQLSAGLTVGSGSTVTLTNVGYAPNSVFNLTSGTLIFGNTQTLDNMTVQTVGTGTLTTGSGTTLTLGPNFLLSGGSGRVNGTGGLINNGLVGASPSATGTYIISSGSFTNNTTVQGGSVGVNCSGAVANSGLLQGTNAVNVSGSSVNNTGTIHSGGGITFGNGNFSHAPVTNSGTVSPGTTLYLSSAYLTNTASAAPINVTGALTLEDAKITGGTVTATGPLQTSQYGGSVVNCTLSVSGLLMSNYGLSIDTSGGGSLTLTGSKIIQLNSAYGGLSLIGNNTLTGATITFSNTVNSGSNMNQILLGSSSTLTLGAGTTISGGSGTVTLSGSALGNPANRTLNNNGIITANVAGSIYAISPDHLSNTGTIAASNGSNAQILTPDFTNIGTVSADGAGSRLSCQAPGNAGIMTVTNGASGYFSDNPFGANPFANTGQMTLGSGTSSQAANGISQSGANSQMHLDGILQLRYGYSDTVTVSGGQIEGTGTVQGNVLNTGGTIKPGDSPGTLTITDNGTGKDGAYTQGSGGMFLEELAGSGIGQYGVLNVGSTATLSGTLNVSLLSGYAPAVGQTFTFLNYGSLSGQFSNIAALDPGYGYSVIYGVNAATLTVVTAAPEPSGLVSLGLGGLGLLCMGWKKRYRGA